MIVPLTCAPHKQQFFYSKQYAEISRNFRTMLYQATLSGWRIIFLAPVHAQV